MGRVQLEMFGRGSGDRGAVCRMRSGKRVTELKSHLEM